MSEQETLNTRWVLASVPASSSDGGYPVPKESDFKVITEPVSSLTLTDGQVLMQNTFLSPDPYVVLYMMKEANLNKTVMAGAIGVVLKSNAGPDGDIKVGDMVVGGGNCGASEYSVYKASDLRKIETLPNNVPMSLYLGLLGMPGCTAYLATRDILGSDLKGQTVVVTGAAGAVGSAVGQIAKVFGAARVVGLAGSAAKCSKCLSKFGYDHMLNYKSTTLAEDLKALAPFHAFYDNTGGNAASLIKALLVDGAPVAKVGAIGGPSSSEHDGRLQIQGFFAGGRVAEWPAVIRTLAGYVADGRLSYEETVFHGIASVPAAFIGQRTGKGTGKVIVDLQRS